MRRRRRASGARFAPHYELIYERGVSRVRETVARARGVGKRSWAAMLMAFFFSYTFFSSRCQKCGGTVEGAREAGAEQGQDGAGTNSRRIFYVTGASLIFIKRRNTVIRN